MTEENKIILMDEDGVEREFELVISFDIKDKTYALLAESEDSDDVFPFIIEEDENGEMTLLPVEDDAEFELISETYDQIMEEEFGDDEDEE
ncbi:MULTISPECIES: DUF1292 domain-containing protein [Eubacterium]|uniref:UPF0473 protein SAMN04488579_10347 n=1 Tax=Eubacterium barkeri TaxID=1528 RepID=A0A1H3CE68_EUBBA|nr:DUF1292 domain-containing protein [Eubacterium barkeri]SDX51799.1 Protein of unknown function [Eubacterium barkeri]